MVWDNFWGGAFFAFETPLVLLCIYGMVKDHMEHKARIRELQAELDERQARLLAELDKAQGLIAHRQKIRRTGRE